MRDGNEAIEGGGGTGEKWTCRLVVTINITSVKSVKPVSRVWVLWGLRIANPCPYPWLPVTSTHDISYSQTRTKYIWKTLSKKRHQHWCLFMFGVCQWVWKGNKDENSPITGGFRGRHAIPVVRLGNCTGNLGVFQRNPYPYPWKPIPVCMGMGFVYGSGFCI